MSVKKPLTTLAMLALPLLVAVGDDCDGEDVIIEFPIGDREVLDASVATVNYESADVEFILLDINEKRIGTGTPMSVGFYN